MVRYNQVPEPHRERVKNAHGMATRRLFLLILALVLAVFEVVNLMETGWQGWLTVSQFALDASVWVFAYVLWWFLSGDYFKGTRQNLNP